MNSSFPEGNAVVYCEGAFETPNGKTAHGLVRFTKRYKVLSVIDSGSAGKDAGEVLDRRPKGIPIVKNLKAALDSATRKKLKVTHFVFGIAPDGGRFTTSDRKAIREAILMGLNVDSGLHDFITEDPELSALAKDAGVKLRDIRKPPPPSSLHFFSGKIEEVASLKVAVLGTDSAVGKRTTAWILVNSINSSGCRAELIGTGQTAWLQGVSHGIIMDSLINDFVSGEIEHAVWTAWKEACPEVLVIEGQGSLMNPAYPGGFEILAAGRPDVIYLQHAPARKEYDGFPGYPIQPIETQIQAIELLSGKPVIAITINHEKLTEDQIPREIDSLHRRTSLPVIDPLHCQPSEIIAPLIPYLKKRV